MIVTNPSQPVFYRHSIRQIKAFSVLFVCLLTIAGGDMAFGQATGSISGTVTDASGSAVPGANVTVTVPATGLTRSSTTNEAGEYIVPLLGVAIYNVQVEQKGFQTAAAQDIRLQVDEHREMNFKLSPATVQTTVEVSATPVADSNCGRYARPSNYNPAGRRSALERPRLRSACHADAGHCAGNQSEQFF